MSKLLTSAILAAVLVAGNLAATAADARPNGRGEQTRSTGQKADSKTFWKKMQRYGN